MQKLLVASLILLSLMNSIKTSAQVVALSPKFVPVPSPSPLPFFCTDRPGAEKIAECFRDEPVCENKLNSCAKNVETQSSNLFWKISAVGLALVGGAVVGHNLK